MRSANCFRSIVSCLALLLFLTSILMAQRVSLTLRGSDGFSSDTIVVGNDPLATNRVDDGSNGTSNLGEEEVLSGAPIFELRSESITSGLGEDTCGLGLKLNLHHQARPTQDDRWRVQFHTGPGGTQPTRFAWQPRLDTVGGGGWLLIDGSPDPDTGAHFPPFDMTRDTSFVYPVMDVENQFIYIQTFDGYKMRSFQPESLALSRDYSNPKGGKITGKGVKRKNWQTDWCFTFVNTSGQKVNDLHVQFDQVLAGDDAGFSGFSPFTTAISTDAAGKQKKWTFAGASIDPGSFVTICGKSWGKKNNKCKYHWTMNGTTVGRDTTLGAPDPGTSIMRLPMADYWNVVEELYSQGAFPEVEGGKKIGLRIGEAGFVGMFNGKQVFRRVIHPAPADVFKTLYNKRVAEFVHTGDPRCLDTMTSNRAAIRTTQKSLPPTKQNNRLVAEAVALKLGVAASDYRKTPPGFGDLVYDDGVNPLSGQTVRTISTKLDTVLSCMPFSGTAPKDLATLADYFSAVQAINSAFSGRFDTVSFGAPSAGPPPKLAYAGTVLTGERAVGQVPGEFLYRPSSLNPAVALPSFKPFMEMPSTFELAQNFPNPFNPTTTIRFDLPQTSTVTLKIYDVLGQEVATLLNQEDLEDGPQEAEWDASAFASGVYFYRIVVETRNEDGIQAGNRFVSVKRMVLLK